MWHASYNRNIIIIISVYIVHVQVKTEKHTFWWGKGKPTWQHNIEYICDYVSDKLCYVFTIINLMTFST